MSVCADHIPEIKNSKKKQTKQKQKKTFHTIRKVAICQKCQNSVSPPTLRGGGTRNLQTNTEKRKKRKKPACCRVLLLERRVIDGKLSVASILDTSPASLPVTPTSIPSGEH